MERPLLRVLSYNIHKGFTSSSRRFVLSGIRDAIRRVHADLVFLQEVVGQHDGHAKNHSDWPLTSQFEFIADELWPHFAYGKNAIYADGHHGNAILSKYPIVRWENVDISASNPMESRGLLHGVIQIPDQEKPLHAICLHLGLFEFDRKKQISRLCDRIASLVPREVPLLVGGDFNDWREQATRALRREADLREIFLELQGAHPRTFPSWLPVFRLDRIYFRGLAPVAARCLNESPWSDLSDHAALYAELAPVVMTANP